MASSLVLPPINKVISRAKTLTQQGKSKAAVEYLNKYLAKHQGNSDLYNFAATISAQIEDWGTAETLFKKALALNANDCYALYNLSKVYKLSARDAEAIHLLSHLIKIDPKNAEALNEIGVLLIGQGHLSPAIRALETATILNPGFASAHKNLYFAYYTQGNFPAAAKIAKKALTCLGADQQWNVRADLIIFLWKSRELDEARVVAEDLIHEIETGSLANSQTGLVNALTNYGLVLMEQDDPEAAEHQFQRVIELAPETPFAYINLAKLCAYQENFEAAIHWFEMAARIDPEHPELHSHLAVFLRDAGRPDLALPHHLSALERSPSNSENRYYLAVTLFALGRLSEAYPNWEYRWSRSEGGSKSNLPIPEWNGTAVADKSLLIYREQGIGDELMFATCLPDATKQFSRVVCVCHSKLHSLFARSFPRIKFYSGNHKFMPDEISNFDLQIAIGTLPSIFRREINSFPDEPQLLTPDPKAVENFRLRLGQLNQTLVIGIAWRSGLISLHRRLIYPYLDYWKALFSIPGIAWVNLQYGDVSEELSDAQKRFGISIINFHDVDHFNDLDQSAALMKACDIVIGPETSTTILSAAVGTPTFRLSTGCDHFRLGTDHYPWFPTITPMPRLFGESWTTAIEKTAGIIQTLVSEKERKNNLAP